eukprot:Gregarina_sp_Pseudo_9__2630@NODE_288_length_3281_cov_31_198643_g270_i0_p1_GENE_NODE_288_length_3281_cov_31_198643_g270_i0NODE_288_length_3281_cov_31_198643_g270_i0_p1_ORF_typecomplete_len561_score46_05_NODE_288_length_3281_cov_31_198643_g270_i015233205
MKSSMMRSSLIIFSFCIVTCSEEAPLFIVSPAEQTENSENSTGQWLRNVISRANVSDLISNLKLRGKDKKDEIENDSSNQNAKAARSPWSLWNITSELVGRMPGKREDSVERKDGPGATSAASDQVARSAVSDIGESVWYYLGKVPRLKGPWGRDSTNATVGSDYVSDVKTDHHPSKVVGDKDGDGIVDVSPPISDESGGLLPSQDLLDLLKCRPSISFSSCLDHCLRLIPPSKESAGYSLTQNLMTVSSSRRLAAEAESVVPLFNTSHLKGEGDRGSAARYVSGDEFPNQGFDPWEVAQLKNCVVSVCTQDYIKTPVPGCLDANGDVVRSAPERIQPLDRKPFGAAGYNDLDFYDPGRLEFWHGMGFFTVQRIWFDIVHGRGLFRIVLLPCIVMLLLSLPMFFLALIVPGMVAGIPDDGLPVGAGPGDQPPPPSRPRVSFHAMDIDDYSAAINPSSIKLCDAQLTHSRLLSRLKQVVDGLTWLSGWLSAAASASLGHSDQAEGLAPLTVEMATRLQYSPIPSSELIPAEEDVDRGKRCLPGTGTTLPSTGKTLPSPTIA